MFVCLKIQFLTFACPLETVEEKEKTSSNEFDETTKIPSPVEDPEQSSEGNKLKKKKSTFGNSLSVLGISIGSNKNADSQPKKAKSKNKCEVSQQNDKDVSSK